MIKQITLKLTQNPSYLRQGSKRLADRFNCSERTINRIKTQLKPILQEYNFSVKTQNQNPVAATN